MARPTGYKPEYAEQAASLCSYGLTDVEIADFFNVAVSTISYWKVHFKEFSEALKPAKDAADDRVERSLFHRAMGYTFDSEKIFCNKEGVVTRVPYREHVPPDTTACIFWLKNRRKDQWRDVHRHEVGQPGDFDRMTPDELRDQIAKELAGSDLLPLHVKGNVKGNGELH